MSALVSPRRVDPIRALADLREHPAICRLQSFMADSDYPLYLVGGAVRDTLTGESVCDFDFAGPAAVALARRFADAEGCSFVRLHDDPATARVPLYPDGCETPLLLDFCALRAPTIEADLCARDFTINAIAVDLRDFTIIDPTEGIADLRLGVVRAIGEENLRADPLRCVRAYRLGPARGIRIEDTTRQWLRRASPGIESVAGARIGEELFGLLQQPSPCSGIRAMDADTVLRHVLPELEPGCGMDQPGFHHLTVRDHAIASLCAMEQMITLATELLPANAELVADYLNRAEVRPLLLMAALLHDVGKPECFSVESGGRMRFTGHPSAGGRIAARILQMLEWPAAVRRAVTALIADHMRPYQLAALAIDKTGSITSVEESISLGAIRRMFRQHEGHEVGLLLTAFADSGASRGPAKHPAYDQALAAVCDQMLRRYVDYRVAMAREPLLSGKDLIEAGYKPGPVFSVILESVDEAYADGDIATRDEAFALARRIANGARDSTAG